MSNKKKIGILTSGGDAPGMNSCIRAVVRACVFYGIKPYGIERGYEGLVENNIFEMNRRSVSDIIQKGGTVLKTARSSTFPTDEGLLASYVAYKENGFYAVVVIGGDGSMKGAELFSNKYNVRTICIPATIDNDLAYTDFTIGFDTAVNTALCAINNIRDTMDSHERICVVEVMGRNSGDIALYSGICGGAETIVLPEHSCNIKQIKNQLQINLQKGKRSNIIVTAEGAAKAETVAKDLQDAIGEPIRFVVLGHLQRGGSPSMADRLLASKMGVYAVELANNGFEGSIAIGTSCGSMFDTQVGKALSTKKQHSDSLLNIAKILSI